MFLYWEEAWLTSIEGYHNLDCRCGDWYGHLQRLCALDQLDAVAAAAIEREDGDGEDVTTGDIADGDPGAVGGLAENTNLPRESAIPALITQPILCPNQQELFTHCTPEPVVSPQRSVLPVSPHVLLEPYVQVHPKPKHRSVHFSEETKTRKRKERKPRKPRVRAPLRVPKAVLKGMDQLMRKREERLGENDESDSSSYFTSDSLTDTWSTSDDDFQSDGGYRPINKKIKKPLKF
uniref:ORF2/2 n=3 Tax=Iotatorquevirus suida1a TaxID=3048408 RepID=E2IVL9_9VIRU|nr:ORF2/2 [Torque teno sus virus 1a]